MIVKCVFKNSHKPATITITNTAATDIRKLLKTATNLLLKPVNQPFYDGWVLMAAAETILVAGFF